MWDEELRPELEAGCDVYDPCNGTCSEDQVRTYFDFCTCLCRRTGEKKLFGSLQGGVRGCQTRMTMVPVEPKKCLSGFTKIVVTILSPRLGIHEYRRAPSFRIGCSCSDAHWQQLLCSVGERCRSNDANSALETISTCGGRPALRVLFDPCIHDASINTDGIHSPGNVLPYVSTFFPSSRVHLGLFFRVFSVRRQAEEIDSPRNGNERHREREEA